MNESWKKKTQGVKLYSAVKNEIGKLVDTMLDPVNSRGKETPDMPFDMFVDGDFLVVEIELPGLTKDEITIDAVGETLEIYGRKDTVKSRYRECVTLERENGVFRKTIRTGMPVDMSKSSAILEDGLLRITLPVVKEKRRKRKITIEQERE
ncbi:MAG: Hsp20/alpha crystallin family protein [bacterium]